MKHQITLDTTLAITAGIEEILHTLFEAVLLVILVVFVFLQNWRATLIPLLTVPVSLIGTFMIFPLLGFSVNTLSLLGLVLAIGIVVDDAIVVVEAVMHHIEHGMSPKEATAQAMKEVSGPVIAIALVLTAVFVPVAFISGITGRLYQQFAITIAVSVMFSAVNALTLSPALASLLLKPKGGKRSFLQPFYDGFNKVFDRFTGGYMSSPPSWSASSSAARCWWASSPCSRSSSPDASPAASSRTRTTATSWPPCSCPTPPPSSAPTRRRRRSSRSSCGTRRWPTRPPSPGTACCPAPTPPTPASSSSR